MSEIADTNQKNFNNAQNEKIKEVKKTPIDIARDACENEKNDYKKMLADIAKFKEVFGPLSEKYDDANKRLHEYEKLEEQKNELKTVAAEIGNLRQEYAGDMFLWGSEKKDAKNRLAEINRKFDRINKGVISGSIIVDVPKYEPTNPPEYKTPPGSIFPVQKWHWVKKKEVKNAYNHEQDEAFKKQGGPESVGSQCDSVQRELLATQKVVNGRIDAFKAAEEKENPSAFDLRNEINKACGGYPTDADMITVIPVSAVNFDNPFEYTAAFDRDQYNSFLENFEQEARNFKFDDCKKLHDLETAQNYYSNIIKSNPTAKYSIRAYQEMNGGMISGNQDLRNIKGKNFRVENVGNKIKRDDTLNDDYNSITNENEFFPPKSYYMNKDYLFTNSLYSTQSPLNANAATYIPEVQKLILNEFQPYEFLTLSDLLGNFGNQVANVMAGVAGSVGGAVLAPIVTYGKNYAIDQTLTNKDWDIYSNTTGQLRPQW